MESPFLSNNEPMDDMAAASLIYTRIPYPIAITLNSIEFVMTLVQIVAATVVLKRTKGEHSEATWIIAYTCACIANLPVLCWRFWQMHNPVTEIRTNAVMFRLKTLLEYFFVVWFLVFFWVFMTSSSSLDHTSQLHWLCVAFLAIGCLRYVVPIVICTAMCCCVSMALCFAAANS